MTDHLKQSISALLDEEASEIEVHRLLREFESEDDLKHVWIRYQQIRAVSQGHHHLSESQHLSLHSSISAAIAEEDHHDFEDETRPAWQKQTAGLAVAASLVLAVFVGVNVQQQGTAPEAEFVSTTPEAQVIDAQPVSTAASASTLGPQEMVAFNEEDLELRELDAEKQQRLREYLMRHDRMSQLNQRNNPVRTVTFPAQSGPVPAVPNQNSSGDN